MKFLLAIFAVATILFVIDANPKDSKCFISVKRVLEDNCHYYRTRSLQQRNWSRSRKIE